MVRDGTSHRAIQPASFADPPLNVLLKRNYRTPQATSLSRKFLLKSVGFSGAKSIICLMLYQRSPRVQLEPMTRY
jgi:hypothetical protein